MQTILQDFLDMNNRPGPMNTFGFILVYYFFAFVECFDLYFYSRLLPFRICDNLNLSIYGQNGE